MQHQAIALPALPASIDRVARIGIPLAFVAAGALSFQGLFSLALAVGWSKWLAWLLPVALDVYAAVSTAVWLNLPAGHEAAKPAARNARVSISLTIGGNAIYHLVATGTLHVGWPLVLAVSTLPPLVAERLLHLVALLPKPVPAAADEVREDQIASDEVVQLGRTLRTATNNRVAAVNGKPTVAQAAITEWWNADNERGIRTPSDKVAADTGVTSSYVRRLYRELDAQSAMLA